VDRPFIEAHLTLTTIDRRKRSRLKLSGLAQAIRLTLNSIPLQNSTFVLLPTPQSTEAARVSVVRMMAQSIILSTRGNCVGYVKSAR
jgi:hypothetical protein